MALQTLKGMQDVLPADSPCWQAVETGLTKLATSYGYEEIRTPILEPLELYLRGVGEHTDIVQKEMFAFADQGGTQMCARPESTAAVMRAYLQHSLQQLKPISKLFYIGPMFRHERPQKGRYRQFHQFGAEAIGKRAPVIDVELIAMAMDIMRMFALPNPRLEINSLGDTASREAYRAVVQQYFTTFSEHLSDNEKQRLQNNPLRLLDSKNKHLQEAIAEAPSILDHLNDDSKAFFDQVCRGLEASNIAFTINTRIVRGLDYYCDTSFEIKVDDLGAQDTVIGGGRYDGLSKTLGGHEVAASGFAMGLERLLLSTGNLPSHKAANIIVLPIGADLETKGLQVAQHLRAVAAKSRIHFLCGISSLKSGLRAATKYDADHVLILRQEDVKDNKLIWKDFASSRQKDINIDDINTTLKDML